MTDDHILTSPDGHRVERIRDWVRMTWTFRVLDHGLETEVTAIASTSLDDVTAWALDSLDRQIREAAL